MRLKPNDEALYQAALAKVVQRANLAHQAPDLTEAMQRLTSARDAILQAQMLIRQIEDEVRFAGSKAHEEIAA